MPFTRSNMYFTDYNWHARDEDDDPRVTGEPDSSLLDRTEGYEMLYFVNKCASLWGWTNPTVAGYRKIERSVRSHVPSNIRAQIGIKDYIERNYKEWWDTL
jgi:hypothetical protein